MNRHAWVYLDDVRLQYVLMVDDELGDTERLAVDKRGCFTIDERGEDVKTIKARGRVWIFDSRNSDFGKWEDA